MVAPVWKTLPGIARKNALGELARNCWAMHISLQTNKLTNEFNRDTFEKQLDRRVEENRSAVRSASFAILFIDLVNFKKVCYAQEGDDAESLLYAADQEMYGQKIPKRSARAGVSPR